LTLTGILFRLYSIYLTYSPIHSLSSPNPSRSSFIHSQSSPIHSPRSSPIHSRSSLVYSPSSLIHSRSSPIHYRSPPHPFPFFANPFSFYAHPFPHFFAHSFIHVLLPSIPVFRPSNLTLSSPIHFGSSPINSRQEWEVPCRRKTGEACNHHLHSDMKEITHADSCLLCRSYLKSMPSPFQRCLLYSWV
jgi:hypothetical protein